MPGCDPRRVGRQAGGRSRSWSVGLGEALLRHIKRDWDRLRFESMQNLGAGRSRGRDPVAWGWAQRVRLSRVTLGRRISERVEAEEARGCERTGETGPLTNTGPGRGGRWRMPSGLHADKKAAGARGAGCMLQRKTGTTAAGAKGAGKREIWCFRSARWVFRGCGRLFAFCSGTLRSASQRPTAARPALAKIQLHRRHPYTPRHPKHHRRPMTPLCSQQGCPSP